MLSDTEGDGYRGGMRQREAVAMERARRNREDSWWRCMTMWHDMDDVRFDTKGA